MRARESVFVDQAKCRLFVESALEGTLYDGADMVVARDSFDTLCGVLVGHFDDERHSSVDLNVF